MTGAGEGVVAGLFVLRVAFLGRGMGCWETPSVALPGMGVTSRGRDGPGAEAEGEGRGVVRGEGREEESTAERYSSNNAGLEAARGKVMFLADNVF